MLPKEKDIIKLLHDFPVVVHEAAENLSPALIANYVYDLAKEFNQFYQEVPVLKEEVLATIAFRLSLSGFVGSVIKTSMNLLGIEVPEKM
jgi:arginyl-tRNA synthetase